MMLRAARALGLAVMAAGCMPTAAAHADELTPFPPPSPRVQAPPEGGYTYTNPQYYPSLAWTATQLVPSPEVGGGRVRRTGIDGVQQDSTELAFGLRWQLTPIVW